MVDFVKRVNKHGADLLHPGEIVLGALNLLPPGGFTYGMIGGVTGGVIGAAIGIAVDTRAKRKDEESRNEGGDAPLQAAAFPGQGVIVAVTDRRLVFFTVTVGRGAPKEIFLDIPYADLDRLERHDAKGTVGKGFQKTAGLRFVRKDGSVFDATTMISGPNRKSADRFFEALAQIRPGDGG